MTSDNRESVNNHDHEYLPELYEEDFDDDRVSSRKRRALTFIIVGIFFISFIFGAFALGKHFKNSSNVTTQIIGASGSNQALGEMTAEQLRDVVVANHLVVYWTGPIAGYKYSFYSPKSGVSVVKYLPAGRGINDTAPNYRVVGTYLQDDATQAVETSGKKSGSVGFTNADGNAVFYVRARPTNVYVAVLGKGVQIEIFDPIADQSLALALFKGQIQQIK